MDVFISYYKKFINKILDVALKLYNLNFLPSSTFFFLSQ